MTVLEIVFPDVRYARMFMVWMSECGEQHYWNEIERYGVDDFEYQQDHLRIIADVTREEENV